MKWELELKPQEKKTLQLGYSVLWPKDKKIQETNVSGSRRFCPVCGAQVFGKFCPECGTPMR